MEHPGRWLALVLLLFSFNCRVQIGVRFMFTLMAVSYVSAAAACADRTWLRWVAGGLVAVTAGVSAAAWPHGLSYFNRLWGDPEAGYTRLHDSNYDWGQGLPELKAWYEAHGGGRPLAVWYYGTDPAVLFPPFRLLPVGHLPVTNGDQLPALAGRGYLAVSVTALYGDRAVTPSTKVAADWLQAREPVARTHTFLVYDLGGN